MYGSVKLPLNNIITSIISMGKAENSHIIWNIRLPRIITAILVGASLAISGTILQAVMRNPLASPGIIGVSAGAGFGATIIIIAIPAYFYYMVPAAFIGSLITSMAIYLLAWKRGVQPTHLILSGIAVASFVSSLTSSIMIAFPERIHGTVDFMIGSLNAKTWSHVKICFPYTLTGITLTLLLAKRINILSLGDDIAYSLGINVETTRLLLITISALLAASAVSVAGLLGFVGLLCPHMMRLLIGSDHKFLIPASIIFSSALLTFCDTLGRIIINPVEIPAGIIMAIIGAPFFLYLLRRKKTNI